MWRKLAAAGTHLVPRSEAFVWPLIVSQRAALLLLLLLPVVSASGGIGTGASQVHVKQQEALHHLELGSSLLFGRPARLAADAKRADWHADTRDKRRHLLQIGRPTADWKGQNWAHTNCMPPWQVEI